MDVIPPNPNYGKSKATLHRAVPISVLFTCQIVTGLEFIANSALPNYQGQQGGPKSDISACVHTTSFLLPHVSKKCQALWAAFHSEKEYFQRLWNDDNYNVVTTTINGVLIVTMTNSYQLPLIEE